MIQPDELKNDDPLKWAVGRGTEVWALFRACVDGDLDAARSLLDAEPALVRTQHAYRTPLYFAVRENRLDVARLLLERGANPIGLAVNDSLLDITRHRGHVQMEQLLTRHLADVLNASPHGEPVAEAIRRRDLPAVRSLLDETPDRLDAGDMRSSQPIHWAVMTRQPEMVDELLARGADINAARADGARPIQLTKGDYHFRGRRDVPRDWPIAPRQMLDHLRSRGAECDLGTACHSGDVERVKALLAQDRSLANRVSPYVTYYVGSGSPLYNAAAGGHLALVKLLLEHGADPNMPEEGIAPCGHALYAAVVARRHDIVELLLDHGAFSNPEVESSGDALSRAISNDDQPMIDLLCAHGAAQAVHLLAYAGDVRTAAAVFAARPELADEPEALGIAASQGHPSFVTLMLRYQPDLAKRIIFSSWSVGASTRALNELLFANGMNPSQPDWLHVTPLHHFARRGDLESASLYLDHGADPYARDEDLCSTPMAWAAKFGQTPMVDLLLKRGVNPIIPTDPRWATPLAWARRCGHADVVALLERHGAGR